MSSFYACEWRRLLQGFDAETRAVLSRVAQTHNAVLAEHFYSAWNVCNNIHVFISLRQCRFFAFYDMYFDFTIASIIP